MRDRFPVGSLLLTFYIKMLLYWVGTQLETAMKTVGDGFVNFGDVVARGRLRQQCQYASRYVDGKIEGYPNLGNGLRFKGDSGNYHSLRIHGDDVDEFVRRVEEYRSRR